MQAAWRGQIVDKASLSRKQAFVLEARDGAADPALFDLEFPMLRLDGHEYIPWLLAGHDGRLFQG